MDDSVQEQAHFFISRAGKHSADVAMAGKIGQILEKAGHRVYLQQWDFANRNFMERMDAALASGARVIAVLTPDYLDTDYCAAEWMHALHGDPLNKRARLIIFRCAECAPRGLLRTIAYWDLVPVRDCDELLKDIVNAAIMPEAERRYIDIVDAYWRQSQPLIHYAIKPTSSFTGRETALQRINDALWSSEDGAAAITQPAAVTGLGGIGKSTLAREYAWQTRDSYAGVWWLNAERSKDSEAWEGIEHGLVELGDHFIRDISRAKDREKAARHTLNFLADGGFTKPWLLIFDNVDDPRVLQTWGAHGNVKTLITSRLGGWPRGVASVMIKAWSMSEAVKYLQSEWIRPDLNRNDAQAIARDLGCLPLALSHAAAYLRDNRAASASSYRAAITAHMRDAPVSVEYDRAVYATFMQQVEQAEARESATRAVLSLAAFYAPDEIPEELFTQAPEHYPPALAEVVADPLRYEKVVSALDKLSLIEFAPATRTFSVHRLVQAAARDALALQRDEWALNAVSVAWEAFPDPQFDTWPVCERLVPHVRAVSTHVAIEDAPIELVWLVGTAATYLQERVALAHVLPLYQGCQTIIERLYHADPNNASLQRDLASTHDRIGSVLRAKGKLTDALAACQSSLAIRERLAQADPNNASWQRDHSASLDGVGDVYKAQSNLDKARSAYQKSQGIIEHLTQADPSNTAWQRDLSVSHNKIGDVLETQGNLNDALAAYQASQKIRISLAEEDRDNASWQRDLSFSYVRIGNVLKAQRNLDDALAVYQTSHVISKRLAKADPENSVWQRDLSISHSKIGDVLKDQGNLTKALAAYKASKAISELLAQADPDNAGWQRDVALSYGRIAMVDLQREARQEAQIAFRCGQEIITRLSAQSPGNATLQRDLNWFEKQIAAIQKVRY